MTDPAPDLPEHLTIRPPRQERSRRAWARVLDAGVTLLEEAGYEGFTIAAVCHRAQVPPRAVYDRAPSKDALFLAVYEHGMARISSVRRAHRIAAGGLAGPTRPAPLPGRLRPPLRRPA